MATATATLGTTRETFDKAYGLLKKDDGKTEPVMLDVEEAEKLSEAGKFTGGVVTVAVDYPATFEGLMDFVNQPQKDDEGNPRSAEDVQEEAVKLFRSGAKVKVMNRLRAILTKVNEKGELSFSGDTVNVTDQILSGSKRVFLTEEQKTWRSLSNLPQNLREQMFDVYLKSIGKEPGQYPADVQ